MSQASYRPASGEALAIIETSGPTTLPVGAVADGQFLKRVGATIVGAAGGVVDVEPPARTTIVSDPIPPGADPALWFTTIQAAINAAAALFAPTASAPAIVLVAFKSGAYGNVVMAPNVNVQMFGADQVTAGFGDAERNAPLQTAGNITYAPTGLVDEYVRCNGLEFTGALAVDFTGKAGGQGRFYCNGRVLGSTTGAGRDSNDTFEFEGQMSEGGGPVTATFTATGGADPFKVLIPEVVTAEVYVGAGIYVDATRAIVQQFFLTGSGALSGPILEADATRGCWIHTTGADPAAVITVRARDAECALDLSTDNLGVHNVDVQGSVIQIAAPVLTFHVGGGVVLAAQHSHCTSGVELDVLTNNPIDLDFTEAIVDGGMQPITQAAAVTHTIRLRNAVVGGSVLGPHAYDAAGVRVLGGVSLNGTGLSVLDEATIVGNLTNAAAGTLNANGASVGGDVTNSGAGTINANGATVGGALVNSGAGVVIAPGVTTFSNVTNSGAGGAMNVSGATIVGDLTNSDTGSIVADGAVVEGNVSNTGAGIGTKIRWRNGTATSCTNTAVGTIVDARDSRVLIADNVMGAPGTGTILRSQTGITAALVAAATVIAFAGAPFVVGTEYSVLITQTAGAGVAATITAQTATTFTINVPVGLGETFAYEIVAK